MSMSWITVHLSGAAGVAFQIFPRDRGDAPPPAVVEAALTAEGKGVVRIPAGYYVVTGRGFETQIVQARDGVTDYDVTLS